MPGGWRPYSRSLHVRHRYWPGFARVLEDLDPDVGRIAVEKGLHLGDLDEAEDGEVRALRRHECVSSLSRPARAGADGGGLAGTG